MKRAQKTQVEAFVQLLRRAHTEMKKQMEKRAVLVLADLLEQCQQGAIALGNMIEDAEGKGFVTVGLLERYCEMLYQIYAETERRNFSSVKQMYRGLHKLLIQIENSVKYDIRIRSEVVFLPYKASMWDSLESIWLAAEADPDCEAYVIPIPYYDKNPDRSFREMHYEGDQYPDYVPVTHYEAYSIAERRPDMIFIHNPYDNYNTVTSVHPFFYSENLKNYTDYLVYISYFIMPETKPDNLQMVETVAHFCITTGAINADRVIVQSEDIRQIYINVLSEFMEKNTGKDTRTYWETKIVGLGSPKTDKVLKMEAEDLEIPEEWRRIIEKSDGGRKKIVFYNTGLAALLQHGGKLLEKIRDVLRVFREYQDEVALLWRPHPLFQATIVSVKPELKTEYENIIAEYCAQGWGIYDDTADMDRAVAVSDVYYGDGSSIVQLFQKVGKPVMIQDVDLLNV